MQKKLPKKELPNFMVKLLSYIDTSAKNMVPDLGLKNANRPNIRRGHSSNEIHSI